MTNLPTTDEEKLKALKDQMSSVVMYGEEWFKIKEKYMALSQKIEKARSKE